MSILVTEVLPNNPVIAAGLITLRRLMGSGINRGTQKGSVDQREREPAAAFKCTAANVRSCVSYRRFIYESVRIRYHFIAYFREKLPGIPEQSRGSSCNTNHSKFGKT